jgi:hypothetical protein
MNLVYIAGPYRSPFIEDIEANIIRARRHHTFWIKEGFASICPHMNTMHLERVISEDNIILPMDEEIISRCDILTLQGLWMASSGTRIEIKRAEKSDLLILVEMPDLQNKSGSPYQYHIYNDSSIIVTPHKGLFIKEGEKDLVTLEALRNYRVA